MLGENQNLAVANVNNANTNGKIGIAAVEIDVIDNAFDFIDDLDYLIDDKKPKLLNKDKSKD